MRKHKTTPEEMVEIKKLGENTKKAILKQYQSVEKFCFENELPTSSVYDLVNGKGSPSFTTIIRVKNALEIDIIKLFTQDSK